MGQKIHPVGFRIGVIRGWDSQWFTDKKGYKLNLVQDQKIRDLVKQRAGLGIVSRVEIERAANRIKVNVVTSRPGAIIGRGGKGIEDLTGQLQKLVTKDDRSAQVHVNVSEVRSPDIDAQLVAENIAAQLEKRVSPRRAMRQAMTRAQRQGARGIKIQISGRLNGAEIARSESDKWGKVPLHTLRADIDYGLGVARTLYGTIGVKVWIYKGEVLPERRQQPVGSRPTSDEGASDATA
ncbi:MAG: 30S ribosomal protein S3 [Fimbriimonadales bacterium]|nr:30S ribosomal protein S3 [Fimbriimonadales bacterium]